MSESDGKSTFIAAYPTAETRGHTGYLTFARKLVSPIQEAGVDKGSAEVVGPPTTVSVTTAEGT